MPEIPQKRRPRYLPPPRTLGEQLLDLAAMLLAPLLLAAAIIGGIAGGVVAAMWWAQ